MHLTALGWDEIGERLGLHVSRGPAPQALPGARRPRRSFWVEPTRALVRYPGQWAMLVEDGRQVTVEWPNDKEPSWVIDRWAAPIAMLQRGWLSLHAVAVEVRGVAVAIAGASGAGKSTTALSLSNRGHDLLCDDVCIVDLSDGQAHVLPFLTDVHLLPDAIEALDLDPTAMTELIAYPGKFAVRTAQPSATQCRLGALICLRKDASATQVHLREVNGAERMRALMTSFAGSATTSIILEPATLFERASALADRARVFELVRPDGAWTLDTVLDSIESVVLDAV